MLMSIGSACRSGVPPFAVMSTGSAIAYSSGPIVGWRFAFG